MIPPGVLLEYVVRKTTIFIEEECVIRHVIKTARAVKVENGNNWQHK